ncbi:hypothetical protein N0V95_002115 [Ascochyta clinopodiicola]|nr:hypothetical protein N0V95_002115 [Ascochyta clinopodiicola]
MLLCLTLRQLLLIPSRPDLEQPRSYQVELGHPDPTQVRSPSVPATSPARIYIATKMNKVERTRLYDLFRHWVPHAEEFYSTHDSLGFSDDEVAAIQRKIVEYRVQTAIAVSMGAVYNAPWETLCSYMGHSKDAPKPTGSGAQQVGGSAEADTVEVGLSDPFGLGLVSSPVLEGRDCSADLMDVMD